MKYSGKKIVSAGIIRNMDFDTEYDRDDYIEKLNNKGIEYEILHLYLVDDDGKYGLVTLEQYNNSPLYNMELERS